MKFLKLLPVQFHNSQSLPHSGKKTTIVWQRQINCLTRDR